VFLGTLVFSTVSPIRLLLPGFIRGMKVEYPFLDYLTASRPPGILNLFIVPDEAI